MHSAHSLDGLDVIRYSLEYCAYLADRLEIDENEQFEATRLNGCLKDFLLASQRTVHALRSEIQKEGAAIR